MTTGLSSKPTINSRLGLESRPGGESWNYVNRAALIFSLISTLLSGFVLGYFYGPLIAVLWAAAASVSLVAMITLTLRVSKGEDHLMVPAIVCNVALIGLWMASSVALFQTGDSAGMVAATSMGWTWISHLLIGGQRNKVIMAITMSMPSAGVLYFLIASAWASYPFWIALAATLSSLLTAAALVKCAQIARDNFVRLTDVTAEAKAMRTKMEFAVASAGDGYFEVDLDSMTLTPNPKFVSALGFKTGQKDANDLRDFMHPEDVSAATVNLSMCRDGVTDGWNQDLRVRMPAGEYRWMTLRARILETGANGRRLLIGSLIDLSARKQLEADMLAAKEAAVASSKAKGEFLANMSHEIRTPLNGVLGMAQALDSSNLSPTDKEKVAIILDSGKSLMALLNDVLDLSKIEAGKLEISPAPGDFVQTIARTRQLFQTQAEEKGLTLTASIAPNFPKHLSFDPVRVRQCVSNLLSNAIKFTSVGEVGIAMSASALGGGEHLVTVEITDTGIGMNEEAVSRLFGLFTQADSSTTRRFGGSGLGLFISRQLARMMGGDIVADSWEGRGSTFTLTFKAKEAAIVAKPAVAGDVGSATSPQSLRGMRVLLTDDNAINRQVIKLFLAPQGCAITEAANGREALDKLAGQPFDIVLLDVHMPVMDGKQAIQRIRASDEPWRNVPVIALTADAMSGDREKYLALGMSDYVSKPVDQRELVAKMQIALGLEMASAAVARTGT